MKALALDKILTLPVAERLHALEVIWESLATVPEAVPLSEEVKAELDRRFVDFEADPAAGTSWDEARDQIVRGTWRTA